MLTSVRPDWVKGWIRLFEADQNGREIRTLHEQENLYLYGGADIAAALVGRRPGYSLGTMYFEYENLPTPSTPIVPPAYDRSGGVAYYSTLASPRDFLRIPITVEPTIISSDPTKFVGNQVSFLALSGGEIGQHVLPFSHTVNSAVFGAGLVASPVPDTQANDIVWSRSYFAANYVLKQQNHQIGIQWTLRFL